MLAKKKKKCSKEIFIYKKNLKTRLFEPWNFTIQLKKILEKPGIFEKKLLKFWKTWNLKLFNMKRNKIMKKCNNKYNKYSVSLSSWKNFSFKSIFKVALKYLFNVFILFKQFFYLKFNLILKMNLAFKKL